MAERVWVDAQPFHHGSDSFLLKLLHWDFFRYSAFGREVSDSRVVVNVEFSAGAEDFHVVMGPRLMQHGADAVKEFRVASRGLTHGIDLVDYQQTVSAIGQRREDTHRDAGNPSELPNSEGVGAGSRRSTLKARIGQFLSVILRSVWKITEVFPIPALPETITVLADGSSKEWRIKSLRSSVSFARQCQRAEYRRGKPD